MVDSLDYDALQAAGIADAQERSSLIEYLAGLGFTVDEMADAEHAWSMLGLTADDADHPDNESGRCRQPGNVGGDARADG